MNIHPCNRRAYRIARAVYDQSHPVKAMTFEYDAAVLFIRLNGQAITTATFSDTDSALRCGTKIEKYLRRWDERKGQNDHGQTAQGAASEADAINAGGALRPLHSSA